MERQKLMRELRGWAITILAVLAFRTFLYEAVYIPSGSMIPTLQIGDYVIVEKWAYGARLPFTETAQVTWASPRRGDIVVLLAPPGNARSDDLIKRVVAVGGDTVELRDGALVLNGTPVPREPMAGECSYWNRGEGGPWREEPCTDFVEQLDGHTYHSYCTPILPCGDVAGHPGARGHGVAGRRPPRPQRRLARLRPGAGGAREGARLGGPRLLGAVGPALGPPLPRREALTGR